MRTSVNMEIVTTAVNARQILDALRNHPRWLVAILDESNMDDEEFLKTLEALGEAIGEARAEEASSEATGSCAAKAHDQIGKAVAKGMTDFEKAAWEMP